MLLAVVGACWAAGLTIWFFATGRQDFTDFDQLWIAARALFAGDNPYAVVAHRWIWPLYYPLPAVILAVPLALLTEMGARVVANAISGGVLAYTITRDHVARAVVLMSGSFLFAVRQAQGAPLWTAAGASPELGGLLVSKPTLGLALGLAFLPQYLDRSVRWRVVGGAFALTAVSLLARPTWPLEWWHTIHPAPPHIRAPITYWGGAIALLALLRWRRPEARLIAFLACVPQTFSLYETVPLFLVPATPMESLVLALASLVAWDAVHLMGGTANLAADLASQAPVLIACLYVPCVFMVLRRPNVAPTSR